MQQQQQPRLLQPRHRSRNRHLRPCRRHQLRRLWPHHSRRGSRRRSQRSLRPLWWWRRQKTQRQRPQPLPWTQQLWPRPWPQTPQQRRGLRGGGGLTAVGDVSQRHLSASSSSLCFCCSLIVNLYQLLLVLNAGHCTKCWVSPYSFSTPGNSLPLR